MLCYTNMTSLIINILYQLGKGKNKQARVQNIEYKMGHLNNFWLHNKNLTKVKNYWKYLTYDFKLKRFG